MNTLHIIKIALMSNIQPAVDEKERRINSEPIFNFKNLPKRENWDPEKYMREHLYMSYSEPRRIKIKLPSENLQYCMTGLEVITVSVKKDAKTDMK